MSFLKYLATNIRRFAVSHKVISAIIVLVVIVGGWYWYASAQGTATVKKYVVEQATQGTVIASVSGSGQVQAVTSIDVKPQVTETVTKVYVQPGDHVVAGQLLVQLDPTNEEHALQQAELSLQSAQLSLAKLQEAPATTTLAQDENALTQDQESIATASTSLSQGYQGGFDTISSAFIDFQTVMTGASGFCHRE